MIPDTATPVPDAPPLRPDHHTPFQIALDGPAGAGKSTVARAVARTLGFTYLDTGAMYRAAALKVRRMTGPAAEADWGAVAEDIDLRFQKNDAGQRMMMDGEDVEDAIRAPEISDWSSRVSANPRVRAALTQRMREMAAHEDVVMEGRDIGTVVLPNARLKIFLTAPEEERARRRAQELEARGISASMEDVLAEIRARDHRDATRADAPLIRAADAVEVSTAGLTPEEVTAVIVQLARERM